MMSGIGFVLAMFLCWQSAMAETAEAPPDSTGQTTVTTEVDDREKAKTGEPLNEDQSSAAPKQSPKGVEKIEVTGSYIKRIDVEGPNPVVTIDAEMFEKTGTNTVNDLIRESAYFEASEDEGNREGYFRFHGQHAGNTLVLLNGMRIPKFGAPGRDFFNGVRAIPTNVISKVDILKDGSSALYGSDAMAGVMNFITKKDFDGAEFSAQTTVPEIGVGIEQNYTMTFGQSYGRGNWFSSLQYVKQDSYTEEDVGSFYRGERLVGAATRGKLGQSSINSGQKCTNLQGKEVDCENNQLPYDYVRTPKENLSAMATGRVDWSSAVNTSIMTMYNRRQRTDIGIPRGIYMNAKSPKLKGIKLSQLGQSVTAKSLRDQGVNEDQLLTFQLDEPIDEFGLSEEQLVEDTYMLQTRTEGYYLDSWTWSVEGSAGYQQENTFYRNGIVDNDRVVEAIASNQFRPLAAPGDRGSLASAKETPTEAYQSHMYAARLFTTGEVADFQDIYGLGGPISLAVGADAQWEGMAGNNPENLIDGSLNINRNPNMRGSRQVESVFSELAMYPLENVELSAAARYDDYSDFGSTFNPKFSVGYRPSNKILFRSSWGTNFHAPSVSNMIAQPRQTFESFEDQNAGPNGGQSRRVVNVPVTRYRDPELGPEKAINYNFGTVIQPNRNWAFTIDQWNFEGTQQIGNISGGDYSDLERIRGSAALEAEGVTIERDADGNILSLRAPEVVNYSGIRTIRGLDLIIDWDQKVNIAGLPMSLNLSANHSQFFVYKTQRFESAPTSFRDDLDWKNTTSASLSSGRNSYRLAARTTSGRTGVAVNNSIEVQDNRPTATEYDLTYSFRGNWGGKLSFGVKNLLNSRPPVNQLAFVDPVAFGGFSTEFSALRRRYFVGYSQTF